MWLLQRMCCMGLRTSAIKCCGVNFVVVSIFASVCAVRKPWLVMFSARMLLKLKLNAPPPRRLCITLCRCIQFCCRRRVSSVQPLDSFFLLFFHIIFILRYMCVVKLVPFFSARCCVCLYLSKLRLSKFTVDVLSSLRTRIRMPCGSVSCSVYSD